MIRQSNQRAADNQAGDGRVILQLKSLLLSKLSTLFHVKPLHCLATLLDSRLRTGILSAEEKLEALTAAPFRCRSWLPTSLPEMTALATELYELSLIHI